MQNSFKAALVHPLTHEIAGEVKIPGSKSFTNRAIILAIAADGVSTIENPLYSDDTLYGLTVAEDLGCEVHREPGSVSIRGIGRRRPKQGNVLNVGSAGTIARFLPCLLAFGDAGEWDLTASPQMSKRPMSGLLSALGQLGGLVECLELPGRYPLAVRGGRHQTNSLSVEGNISSQYLSGILLSAPLLTGGLSVSTAGGVVQSAYVDMTIDCMRSFGAEVETTEGLKTLKVKGGAYHPTDIAVEADASTASYFAALPAIVGGSILLSNISKRTKQPDIRFLEILEAFGCSVSWIETGGVVVERPRETTRIKGGHKFNLNDCSDIALTVAAISVFADSPVTIEGVEHIRHHESDRIAAMTQALTAMAIRVEERHDGWKIWPSSPSFASVATHDDHRVAMALAVVGLAGSGVRLDQPSCVSKTCPDFYALLADLGANITI
ncbi:3-phosphoshikimate 1-carboxyvinyltransferase [Arthrobacter sp. NtRootA1]|uniref:3-phosphoshikimate 1-carboxyvinyltransferase n=1 Tax=Arthrobacter sp. NtRootA1 TaxID=2830983 RepID=UPI001CC62018|nr:3-phosphoshikimate 1-carboxyvinyltransferase [Arthrobacter sp. NtRootA1]BCW08033.1 3-phosphoshikimate 1-carboxyvinyltransferase [Arthrobacter sp. NtRootA1]